MTPAPVPDRSKDDLGVVLTGLTLAGMILAAAAAYGGLSAQVTAFGLSLVYIFGGLPSAARALHSLWVDHVLDIDLLMVVAALAAAAVGATFEGAVLLTLFSLSGTLENQAMGKARRAVEALMALRPETALLRRDGTVAEVPVASLAAGDVVVIRPGSRMPVDGTILSGEGAINESTVTGESVPVVKGPGSSVFEATVNLDGVLDLRVDRSASESTVARMIQLVTQAQAAKAPSERFSSWFGQRYTAAVLAGSVIAFGLFLWLGWPQQDALYRAATLLVAASPCAIVISVPAAILSALSAAARGGVLFKGGAALENAFLALIAGIEAQSEHHIASAIRRLVDRRGLTPASVTGVTAIPSEGIVGTDDIGPLWAGNPRLAARMGAALDDPGLLRLAGGDQTVIYMGRGRQVLGAVAVADQTRASSQAGILALRKSGIRQIAMMTGDRRPVALRIGSALGLRDDEIHADLLPEDKVVLIADLAAGGKVAYVGDGVNDAAALARADVGIAMGAAGSDVALQAADVALLSENMERLAAAHLLARRTGRIIRQNLVFAMGAMLVLVTGSLFFNLPLPLAVVGHEGGTVLVVLNGLRLLFDPIRSDRA